VCRRCNAAGICAPVGSETDPDEDCPDDGAESCGRTGVCREGACALYSDQTVCRSAECNSSFQRVPERFCDGSGVCDEAILETCDDDYACSGGACLTSCASDDDCLNGTACSQQATCQGGKDQQCASDPECASGACCGIITRECKDPESDPYNCGGCANICFGGFGWSGACVSGECVPVCHGGYLDCDGDDHNGCEIWLGAPVLPALATIDLGSHCGDFGCGSHSRCTAVGFDMSTLMGWQEAVGSLAMFAKVKECTSCWFTDLGAHIVLRSPPSADYDLHVFKGILAGTKVGSSTNVGAGVQDALSIRFTDNVLVSEYTYYIVVEWKSGASCEEWRLEIYGTTCP
jgi:hypothetical protein